MFHLYSRQYNYRIFLRKYGFKLAILIDTYDFLKKVLLHRPFDLRYLRRNLYNSIQRRQKKTIEGRSTVSTKRCHQVKRTVAL